MTPGSEFRGMPQILRSKRRMWNSPLFRGCSGELIFWGRPSTGTVESQSRVVVAKKCCCNADNEGKDERTKPL
jgi:hypothetical protein